LNDGFLGQGTMQFFFRLIDFLEGFVPLITFGMES
jgi:hypothetical protein